MNVLFVTPLLPAARSMGGMIFSQAIIDRLRADGARVEVLGWEEVGRPLPADPDARSLGPRAVVTRLHPVAAIGWAARSLWHGEPFSVAKFRSRRFDAGVRAAAARSDLVVVDHQLAWVADCIPADMPLLHISHQLVSSIHDGSGLIARRERALLSYDERRLAARATRVWTITPDDAVTFRALGAAHACDLSWTPPPQPAPIAAPTLGAVLLGNWAWKPNRQALDWFVVNVLPRLDGLVTLAGRGTRRWRGISGLSVIGEVRDAAATLAAARVIVVPSIGGPGLHTKTLVAMTAGRPVVATPQALRHIDERPAFLTLEDDPTRFAAAITRELAAPITTFADPFNTRRATSERTMSEEWRALRAAVATRSR